MTAGLIVDRDQLHAFVAGMFRHADESTWLSLRGFFDDQDGVAGIRAVQMNGSLEAVADRAVEFAQLLADDLRKTVCAPPLATFANAEKATEAALANGLALSVECDKDATRARQRLEFLLGQATVVVASGGTWTDLATGEIQDKLHIHWRLKEPTRTPEAHARLKQARAIATTLVGGDVTNTPAVHPLRWPGSWHRKGEPKLCRIVDIKPEAEIDLDAALSTLLDIQPESRQGSDGGWTDPGEDRETTELIRRVMTGEEYHAALRDLAWRYLKGGMAAAQVVITLRGIMDAMPESARDARWQHRRGQIPMLVRTAQEKQQEEALCIPSSESAQAHTPPERGSVATPKLALHKDILATFLHDVRACGLVGECATAQLLYLVITSRLLAKPVSAGVKGHSSSGKSHTLDRVIEFFPPEAVVKFTCMSERALVYRKEEYSHRTLVIYEVTGLQETNEDNLAAYFVRSLLSEGRLEYEVTVRGESGRYETQRMVKEGPTNLIFTTTKTKVHAENETRVLSLNTDDGTAQTRSVLLALANEADRAVDLDEWRGLQAWLQGAEHRVTIPYGRKLAEAVPPLAVRLRRDFGAVLALIRAHAILHQATRGRDASGRIVATAEDYEAVRGLVADVVSQGIGATVSDTVRETVHAVKVLTFGGQGALVGDIARELKIDRSNAGRRVHRAADGGYIRNLEDKRGKPGRWIIGEPLPDAVEVLPHSAQVCAAETRAEPGLCACAPAQEGIQDETESGLESVPPRAASEGLADQEGALAEDAGGGVAVGLRPDPERDAVQHHAGGRESVANTPGRAGGDDGAELTHEAERIGSCSYCKDVLFADDVQRTVSGELLHTRCLRPWANRAQPASPPYVCASCGEPVRGLMVKHAGRMHHQSCLVARP